MLRLVSAAVGTMFITAAGAVDCPPGVLSCKVLTLSPQEEQILLQPNGILDTAAQGRKIDLGEVTLYFRNKIQAAPAGEVKAPAQDAPPAAPK